MSKPKCKHANGKWVGRNRFCCPDCGMDAFVCTGTRDNLVREPSPDARKLRRLLPGEEHAS